jgi:hypothetical protein
MSSGSGAAGPPGATATLTRSPAARRWLFGRRSPSTVTTPASIRRCASARDPASGLLARNASRRAPASSGPAVSSARSVAPPSPPRRAAGTPRRRCSCPRR